MTYAESYLGNDQLHVGDGSGSAVPALSSSDSPSAADSPASSSAMSSPSGHSAQSVPGLDLCVDLSTYSLPQLTSTDLPSAPPPIRQHPMVLRPRRPKTANISSVSASSPPVSTLWVMSPLYS